MKKLKSLLKKHGARIGALAMCFMLLIPMLCSATDVSYSVPYTLTNPDNLPQELTITAAQFTEPQRLDFGSGTLFTPTKGYVVNGSFVHDGLEVDVSLPDGDYLVFGFSIEQPSGYASTIALVNGSTVTLPDDGVDIPAYYSDSLDFVVVERDNDLQLSDRLIVFLPFPTPTDSITSVWTSITNWVISSLNTVQGVFVNPGIHYYVNEYPEFAFTYDGNSYGAIDYDEFFSYRYLWYDGHRIDSMSELTQTFITINGTQFGAYSYDGTVLAFSDGVNYMAIDNGLLGVSNTPNPNSLTLLGTLTVIGLSIAVVFLLIGIIQRFLRLRG